MKVKVRLKKKLLKALGQRIKYLRIQCKISQEALAFKIGVDRTYVGAIEQGLRSPSLYCLYMIAKALNTTLKDISELSVEE